MRLKHTFPLTPFCRAISIFSSPDAALGLVTLPQGFFALRILKGNSRRLGFALSFSRLIYFPVLLGSTVIGRFFATMRTLTSAGRLSTFLPQQISCVHCASLA